MPPEGADSAADSSGAVGPFRESNCGRLRRIYKKESQQRCDGRERRQRGRREGQNLNVFKGKHAVTVGVRRADHALHIALVNPTDPSVALDAGLLVQLEEALLVSGGFGFSKKKRDKNKKEEGEEKLGGRDGKVEPNTVWHAVHVTCPSITSFFLHLLHENFQFAGFLFVLTFLGVCEVHPLLEEETSLVLQLRFPKIQYEF
jgi:hypothetical protein